MKKKVITLLLAVCMTATMLVGCSGSTPESTPTGKVLETPKASGEEYTGSLPFGNGETVTIGLVQNENVVNYDSNPYTLWLEEQTGVKIKFVYFSSDRTEAATQLALMVSSGQTLPDIIWNVGLDSSVYNEYGEDGYYIDLNNYFQDYGYYFWQQYNRMDKSAQESLFKFGADQTNGAMYAFPIYQTSSIDSVANMTYINEEWLKTLKLDMPKTTDELRNVLIAFRDKDPNGNGVADEIPMIGMTLGYRTDIVSWLLNSFVYVNDNYFFDAKDGQLYVPYTTDEYREGLRYINGLVEDGLLSTLTWTMSGGSELSSIVTPSDGVAIAGAVAMHPMVDLVADSKVALQYVDLTGISSKNCVGYAPLYADTYMYNTYITSDCADPILAFKLLDFMSSRDSFLRMRYGQYDVDWKFCESGEKDSSGGDALITIINTVNTTQNNQTWNQMASTFCLYNLDTLSFTDDGSWSSTVTKLCYAVVNDYYKVVKTNNPEEVVYRILYDSQETKAVQDMAVTILNYIMECRAEFCTGVLDIDSDDDWNTYLNNLEDMGLSTYLKTAQAAYTRQNG